MCTYDRVPYAAKTTSFDQPTPPDTPLHLPEDIQTKKEARMVSYSCQNTSENYGRINTNVRVPRAKRYSLYSMPPRPTRRTSLLYTNRMRIWAKNSVRKGENEPLRSTERKRVGFGRDMLRRRTLRGALFPNSTKQPLATRPLDTIQGDVKLKNGKGKALFSSRCRVVPPQTRRRKSTPSESANFCRTIKCRPISSKPKT